MRSKLILMRRIAALGAFLLAVTPSLASAHDNLGGDELAAAYWMLVGAIVVIVLAVLAGLWAFRAGQFSNVEESKFRMIDNSEDYDAIMAEALAREQAARQAERSGNRDAGAEQPSKRRMTRELEDQHVVP
jgi:nitrogen fixation-related uncharacterized protein